MAVAFTDWKGTCLIHHGIKGQKWGIRRYQNPDGTLTELGKKRQQKEFYKELKRHSKSSSFGDMQNNDVIRKRSAELDTLTKKTNDLYKKGNDLLDRYHRQEERTGKTISDRDKQRLKSLYNEANASDNELHKQALGIADDLLGKYGKKQLNLDYNHKRSSSDIARRLLTEASGENVYKDEQQKEAFEDFRTKLKNGEKFTDYFRDKTTKQFDHEKLDKVYNHIEKKESKLIDEWWKKKTTGDWRSKQTRESFDAEAMRYAKQAARDMGLPVNQETLYFLLDRFFNGDD